jgi:hypothetical protein
MEEETGIWGSKECAHVGNMVSFAEWAMSVTLARSCGGRYHAKGASAL